MKSAVGALILFSVLLCCADARIRYVSNRCSQGESWMEKCNKCFCPVTGLRSDAFCTRKACSAGGESAGQSCKQGESWMEDCNKCFCPRTGPKYNALCSRHKCIAVSKRLVDESEEETEIGGFGSVLESDYVFENETHCTPGSNFYLSCNTCFCQKSGIKKGSGCDNNGCPPFPALYDISTKCVPGTKFMDDCNSCTCGSLGTVRGSVCTMKGCVYFHP